MKIYLAGRFRTASQTNTFADRLELQGHQVVSTWHRDEAMKQPLAAPCTGSFDEGSSLVADKDLDEIDEADALIALTRDCEWTPGGLWFEMGYAYRGGKQVYIVGPRHNIFCHLPHVEEWKEAA